MSLRGEPDLHDEQDDHRGQQARDGEPQWSHQRGLLVRHLARRDEVQLLGMGEQGALHERGSLGEIAGADGIAHPVIGLGLRDQRDVFGQLLLDVQGDLHLPAIHFRDPVAGAQHSEGGIPDSPGVFRFGIVIALALLEEACGGDGIRHGEVVEDLLGRIRQRLIARDERIDLILLGTGGGDHRATGSQNGQHAHHRDQSHHSRGSHHEAIQPLGSVARGDRDTQQRPGWTGPDSISIHPPVCIKRREGRHAFKV